jgi:aryl-alcohol dehydrogenase-like predicted oxidoreductase
MYADGGAEEVVGDALQGGLRDKVYLVSKVYPWNAGGKKQLRLVRRACAV